MTKEKAQEIVNKLHSIREQYDLDVHPYCYEYAVTIREKDFRNSSIYIPIEVIDVCYEFGCSIDVCTIGGGYQGMRMNLITTNK